MNKKTLLFFVFIAVFYSCKNNHSNTQQNISEAEHRAQAKIDAIVNKKYTDSSSGRVLLNQILKDTLAKNLHNKAVNKFDSMKNVWNYDWVKHNARADSLLQDQQKRIRYLISKTSKQIDDIDNITFYTHKSNPRNVNSNSFMLYIGQSGNSVWLRLRISYSSNDWLFVKRYTLKADDLTRSLNPEYGEVKTDHDYSGIWEWYDTTCDDYLLSFIKQMSTSKVSKVRYHGSDYHHDKTLTNTEKKALEEIIELYYALQSPSAMLM